MSQGITQKQHYWLTHRRICDLNNLVMELINCKENPLTKDDLHRLADRHPDRYERFRNLLD